MKSCPCGICELERRAMPATAAATAAAPRLPANLLQSNECQGRRLRSSSRRRSSSGAQQQDAGDANAAMCSKVSTLIPAARTEGRNRGRSESADQMVRHGAYHDGHEDDAIIDIRDVGNSSAADANALNHSSMNSLASLNSMFGYGDENPGHPYHSSSGDSTLYMSDADTDDCEQPRAPRSASSLVLIDHPSSSSSAVDGTSAAADAAHSSSASTQQSQPPPPRRRQPRRGSLDSSTLKLSRQQEQERVRKRLQQARRLRQSRKKQEQQQQQQQKKEHEQRSEQEKDGSHHHITGHSHLKHTQSIVSTASTASSTTAPSHKVSASRPLPTPESLGYESTTANDDLPVTHRRRDLQTQTSTEQQPGNRRRAFRRRCSVTKFSLDAAEQVRSVAASHGAEETQTDAPAISRDSECVVDGTHIRTGTNIHHAHTHLAQHKSSSLPNTPLKNYGKPKVDMSAFGQDFPKLFHKQKRRSSLDMMMQNKRQQEQRFQDLFGVANHDPNLLHDHISQHTSTRKDEPHHQEEQTLTTASTAASSTAAIPHHHSPKPQSKKHRSIRKKSMNLLFGAFRRSNSSRKLKSEKATSAKSSSSSSNGKQVSSSTAATMITLSTASTSSAPNDAAAGMVIPSGNNNNNNNGHNSNKTVPSTTTTPNRRPRMQRRCSVTKFSLEATEQIQQEFLSG
mmetsp:Transcript_5920/g.17760  ORF Transcript_5920/g.17760 Transcript_5920/m.17760 type:complete len:681 (+) Transcript_5920:311-2353(+)|eukprot:CAMPEP_0119560172 /NCGR_PEP_ID=MMETSP1352-20130426/14173_1 /TAXON_ID=265584 /ORGANISM="Stauroneis constricta, Strain CCMP1120" /LENGTH=680 /DNA_ID=CAMNT_0007608091 /DNA_START=306 /DNA_END=2351 /DNA_ORIENTATION=+